MATNIKSSIQAWIQDKIGIGENRDRLQLLSKRLDSLAVLQQMTLPVHLPLSEQLQDDALRLVGLTRDDVCLAIHRSDPMFRYPLQHYGGQLEVTLAEYVAAGHGAANVVASMASGAERLLDFGCGYGRVSRFLRQALPDVAIHGLDPKASAMAFQLDTLGLMPHSDGLTYDLLFAGSVFTHLRPLDFKAALKDVVALLSPGGKALITLHPFIGKGYQVFDSTEESALPELEDNLNESDYVSAYCSRDFLDAALMDSCPTASVEVLDGKLFGGSQVYIAIKL